jgi:23S rRNA pseudouridine955/2504/2580 synthase
VYFAVKYFIGGFISIKQEKETPTLPVLYEDDAVVVYNKPAGLSVQGGSGVGVSVDSIVSGLAEAGRIAQRPLLVHRLDKETSGAIILANNKAAASFYTKCFADGIIKKKYITICSPSVNLKEKGEITMSVIVHGVQKNAKTHYRVIAKENGFVTLEIELDTGRMHQIRQHLFKLGSGILGDDRYGDFALNKRLKKECGLKNMLLHAMEIAFPEITFPVYAANQFDNKMITVQAPLPAYFGQCRL